MNTASMKNKPRLRVFILDALRGVAFIAMALFHFTWDLYFVGLIDYNITFDATGRWIGTTIAGTFLAIVGASLVLALPFSITSRSYLIRLLKIATAASLVTLATFFAMPHAYIYFGILHSIALSSLLALPFLHAPIWFTIASAIAIFALGKSGIILIDNPWLDWTGIAEVRRPTMDFEPIIPWFAYVLTGIAIARIALIIREHRWWANWQPNNKLSRAFTWMGRHSLTLYLIHQPILLPLAIAIAFLLNAMGNG